MRLLVCAGGTGGGVYPAIAVLQAVEEIHKTNKNDVCEILWVGSEQGMEKELVVRELFTYRSIPAAGVHGVGLRALPKNVWKVMRGIFAARSIIKEFKPDVMFFTGGYVAFPVAIAGFRIPKLVFVPDIEPGFALKLISGMADQIAVSVDATKAYFSAKKHTVVTGYPTRETLTYWDKELALTTFRWNKEYPVLLVVGGSLGAHSINRALISVLEDLLQEMRIIHITGKRDWTELNEIKNSLPPDLKDRYQAFDYLHELMGTALTAADLVLSRGGASCLGEYPLFGLPAIIVPYPHAWRYQKLNAEYLVEKGAALILPDEELPTRIKEVVLSLMRNKTRRKRMAHAMFSLRKPNSALNIAELLYRMAEKHDGEEVTYG
ncbi:MAG: UDP-N-acetylglucosamine--N-acetylmuramyl-(pentapeptide) pyrophosphoryl-undecaprenol N-acetylglucosamine transferase [Anaerolineales bacterium]|nr:UDP-N-acetylglucosamine--N-acetylmuramyl-(pentapeptide) pyrophosphoryl-undecaprenol N-acetylglucosamine transferase [Anaerolineales bacterium]